MLFFVSTVNLENTHSVLHTHSVLQPEGTGMNGGGHGFMNTDGIKKAAEVVPLAPAKFDVNFGARIASLENSRLATEGMNSPLLWKLS